MKPILNLKNDLVFKAVFSREEDPMSSIGAVRAGAGAMQRIQRFSAWHPTAILLTKYLGI